MDKISQPTDDYEDEKDLLPGPRRMSTLSSDSDDKSLDSLSPAKDKTQALKKPANGIKSSASSTTSEQESSLSSSTPYRRTYVEFPAELLPQRNDDCDETERLARKRRCDEIIALSEKIVAEAKHAASIRPLKWAEPTFNPFSFSNMINAPAESQQAGSARLENDKDDREREHKQNLNTPEHKPALQLKEDDIDAADHSLPPSEKRRRSSEI